MVNKTVFSVALLAVASFAAPVQAADSRTLNGVWQCHFRKTKTPFESYYFSNWTFDAAKKQVIIMWSPVHNGKQLAYDWDGKQLVLNSLSASPHSILAKYKAEIDARGALVIEMPKLRWKGWLCHAVPSEQWPADGLQFLDYTRYPWLSSLTEDGASIMKYRDPEQYQEFMEGRREGLRGVR